MEVVILVLWILPTIFAPFVAHSKGRNPILWLVATLLFPIVFLFLLFGGDARKCPFCKEGVKKNATVCSHCQRDIPALA